MAKSRVSVMAGFKQGLQESTLSLPISLTCSPLSSFHSQTDLPHDFNRASNSSKVHGILVPSVSEGQTFFSLCVCHYCSLRKDSDWPYVNVIHTPAPISLSLGIRGTGRTLLLSHLEQGRQSPSTE